jgi:hypothetical protein
MIEHIAGKNADLGLRVIQWRPRTPLNNLDTPAASGPPVTPGMRA